MVKDVWKSNANILTTVSGEQLMGSQCRHPLNDRIVPILPGDHVTTLSGTGFVHTAPGHGHDDFKLCKAHGIVDILSPIDDSGFFTCEAGKEFEGKFILREGNEAVIEALRSRQSLLQVSDYRHLIITGQ